VEVIISAGVAWSAPGWPPTTASSGSRGRCHSVQLPRNGAAGVNRCRLLHTRQDLEFATTVAPQSFTNCSSLASEPKIFAPFSKAGLAPISLCNEDAFVLTTCDSILIGIRAIPFSSAVRGERRHPQAVDRTYCGSCLPARRREHGAPEACIPGDSCTK